MSWIWNEKLWISLFVHHVSGKSWGFYEIEKNSWVRYISGGKSHLLLVHKFTNHSNLSLCKILTPHINYGLCHRLLKSLNNSRRAWRLNEPKCASGWSYQVVRPRRFMRNWGHTYQLLNLRIGKAGTWKWWGRLKSVMNQMKNSCLQISAANW